MPSVDVVPRTVILPDGSLAFVKIPYWKRKKPDAEASKQQLPKQQRLSKQLRTPKWLRRRRRNAFKRLNAN